MLLQEIKLTKGEVDYHANSVLCCVAEAGRNEFLNELEPVELVTNTKLARAGGTIEHSYFPVSGLVSIVGRFSRAPAEVGLVGRDSFFGMRSLLGGQRMPVDVVVEAPGRALRIKAERFTALIWDDSDFYALFMPFLSHWVWQMAETASANARCSIKERVVRRLLMMQDRLRGTVIPVTHASMADALAVRRPSITLILSDLEKEGLVRNERGRVTILSRSELVDIAGPFYTPVL